MNRRDYLGLVIAAGVLVVVVVAIIALTTADVSAVGLRVNGSKASQSSIDEELSDFAKGRAFAASFQQSGQQLKTTKGAVNSTAAAQWMAFRVQKALAEQILAHRGVEVTQKDVDRAHSALEKQGTFAGMSGPAETQLSEYQAAVTKLTQEAGGAQEAVKLVTRAARRANVDMDPRYGTWSDRRVGICPTTGCRQFISALPTAQQ
jgi:hypothetical protein